jgi:DNA invertase Pin-like site-specific DNA recombinase
VTALKIAAAYIRVSTDMQTEYSPDSQLRLIREYAGAHQFVVPDEYIYMEQGISGKRADKRPEFQKMMAAAKNKEFEAILIYHTSRFARNHEESIVYKSMLKRDCGVDVISITQPPIDKKTDMLTNAIYSVMDEWYSIDLAANVKRGMTEKAMRGGYQCSPPYGYRIPGYKQPPVIVEDEAQAVRIAFDLYLNGQTSMWNIGKTLTEMGYRTRRGNAFERRAVEYMLTNPIYKGVTVWNKRTNNKTAYNDPSDWIIAEGSHDAIIPPDEFDRVQEMYRKNRRTKNVRPPGTYGHWLTGIFKCGACGRGLTYSHCRYSSFSCNGYKKGICKSSNFLRQEMAEDFVDDVIKRVADNVYEISLDQIVKRESSMRDISLLEDKRARADRKLQRYKDAYSAGYDTLDEYGANKKAIAAEKAEIDADISKLKSNKIDMRSVAVIRETAKTVYEKLHKKDLSTEEKSRLVRTLINKIVYSREANTFEVFFNL